MSAGIYAHFVEGRNVFAKRAIEYAPSVGDELRFSDKIYFTVTKLVWCMDEESHGRQRLNIGIERIVL
jgi:hypothetical protein